MHDAELFESTFLHYKDQSTVPKITELGFLAQSAATLRRSEYTAFLIHWFAETLQTGQFTDQWKLRNEFAFA